MDGRGSRLITWCRRLRRWARSPSRASSAPPSSSTTSTSTGRPLRWSSLERSSPVLRYSRHSGRLRHVRGSLLRPSGRRRRLRALRGSRRTQGDSHILSAPDGCGDVPDRAASRLRRHRHLGAGVAGGSALLAGLRPRRRVGRRCPHGHGARHRGQARFLLQLSPDGAGGRVPALERALSHPYRLALGITVRLLGLADSLPVQRGSRRDRALRQGHDSRDAGLQGSGRGSPSSTWCAPTRWCCS
jgi:hypothetical protein